VCILEQAALNTSSLQKIQMRNTQHYNYLQRSLKQKVFRKVINMPWVQRPSGLIKWGEKA
jgi:hypothetical protein